MLFSSQKVPGPSPESRWQTLEAAAVQAWAAGVFKGLLARTRAPLSSARPVVLPPAPTRDDHEGLTSLQAADGSPFARWSALADEYATQFLLMQRGDPHARDKAMRLSKDMLRMNQEMTCSA